MHYQIQTLENGLTLITVPIQSLDSVTTLLAVGAGSRYETKKISGISHFLEHMFFKGSRKYPTAEIIANLVDGVGAVNNASTGKEYTFYWIKSAAKHLELASDLISSMVKESLLVDSEIEKEKGVIIEELRMFRDNPQSYVGWLYERLQFGDQPLGWDIGGLEETIASLGREDFTKYMDSLYAPTNMALVYAGKIPTNIKVVAEAFFSSLPKRAQCEFTPFIKQNQKKSRVNIFYKDTDQANLILGMEAYDRYSKKRYAARLLGIILGEGMSSRLFIQVREKRGLAYHVSASFDPMVDTGSFSVYAGLKLEKIDEGLEVIKAELERTGLEKVTEEELRKAKEIVRGRIALRSESTNFLAEHFGVEFVLDRKLESFEDYQKAIDTVTKEDIQEVARDLIKREKYNLQMIAPFKETNRFEKILNA